MLIGNNWDTDVFLVLSKSHLRIYMRDMFEIFKARMICRENVLAHASIRHEPCRLIDVSFWGKDLFSQKIVQEITHKAAKVDRSLLEKWGSQF